MTYGHDIKMKRVEKDLKIKDVAKIFGIHPSYLSMIENDKVMPGKFLKQNIDSYFYT